MSDWSKLVDSGRELGKAFTCLEKASDYSFPCTAQVTVKRGLLDEARRAINAARALLAE